MKKTAKIIIAVLLLTVFVLGFTACNNYESDVYCEVTLKYAYRGRPASKIATITVKKGTTIGRVEDLVDNWYSSSGALSGATWYTDADLKTVWNTYKDVVTNDMTLYTPQ